MKKITLLMALPLVSACSTIGIGPDTNTGQVDYRIAEPVAVTPQQIDAARDHNPVTRARLVRRYSGSDDVFNSSATSDVDRDVFSIVLEQAIVGQYIGEWKWAQPAEVAVLANAFEFGEDATVAGSPRFFEYPEITGSTRNQDDSPNAVGEGMKLIYFSTDVYLGQPLNFSALPIIAPTQYHGRPIGIQLVILELDRLPGPVKALMRELASLGRASNVSSALPGLGDIALELGNSMLNGDASNDDLVFEYRFVLYPEHLSSSQGSEANRNETATFQPGRYVIRRVEPRGQQMTWDGLVLDHNTGRLYAKKESDGNCNIEANPAADDLCEYRDDTYLVLNILKHAPGTPEAEYAHQSLADFNSVLEAASQTDGTQSLNAITDGLRQHVTAARSSAWLTQLTGQWNALQRSLNRFDELRYPGSPNVSLVENEQARCQAGPAQELAAQLLDAELRANHATAEFVETYQQAIQAGTASDGNSGQVQAGNADPQLKASDQTTLVNRIALFAVPRDSSLRDKFGTIGAFRTNFIEGKDPAVLAKALTDAVLKRSREFSCEQLAALGWHQPVAAAPAGADPAGEEQAEPQEAAN